MRFLCVHHSADQSTKPQYQKVWQYHNGGAGGKWPKGHGIQYTHFIESDGTRIQTYNRDKVTWHSGSDHWNRQSFGVCLAGSGVFTDEQIRALFAIWRDAGFPPIVYHREIRPEPTQCPGSFPFREELEKLRLEDLKVQLKLAEKALPRFEGTRRGNLLHRLIDRLRSIIFK